MRIYGINIYLLMVLALFSDPHLDRCPQIIRRGVQYCAAVCLFVCSRRRHTRARVLAFRSHKRRGAAFHLTPITPQQHQAAVMSETGVSVREPSGIEKDYISCY